MSAHALLHTGCSKEGVFRAGLRVAAIFLLPICPDLAHAVNTTRPVQAISAAQAH